MSEASFHDWEWTYEGMHEQVVTPKATLLERNWYEIEKTLLGTTYQCLTIASVESTIVPSMSRSIPANVNTSDLPVKEGPPSSRGMVTPSKTYPSACSVDLILLDTGFWRCIEVSPIAVVC